MRALFFSNENRKDGRETTRLRRRSLRADFFWTGMKQQRFTAVFLQWPPLWRIGTGKTALAL